MSGLQSMSPISPLKDSIDSFASTRYLRKERVRFSVTAPIKDGVNASDERSNGMFPLITNRRDLPLKAILETYKFQPKLEKRHEQLKSVQNLTAVWLKSVNRIEALLVHTLLKREVRQGMTREGPECLPLYPGERECRVPSTESVLEVFAPHQRHRLFKAGRQIQVFEPDPDDLHRQILDLMRLPHAMLRSASRLCGAISCPQSAGSRGGSCRTCDGVRSDHLRGGAGPDGVRRQPRGYLTSPMTTSLSSRNRRSITSLLAAFSSW